MGFLFSLLGDPSWPSHSNEVVPALDVDDRDPCRRMCFPRVLDGDDVEKPCLFFGSFDGERYGAFCGGTFGGEGGTRRTREPRTFLRGERSVVVRDGSTTTEANVLEDQRLRRRSSEEGELGKEKGEMGVFEEVEEVKDDVESMEERGASESMLERKGVALPYIPYPGVSWIARGSGLGEVEAEYVKEG